MLKKTIEDLNKIEQETLEKMKLSEQGKRVRIDVHMGTCGIASGAREVLDVLKKEVKNVVAKNVDIKTTGCMGICSKEPLITVEVFGQEPIIYEHMNEEKAKVVFHEHILSGKVVKEYAFCRGRECDIKERIKNGGKIENQKIIDENIPAIENIKYFSLQEPRVMRNRGIIDPNNINEYIARNGYKAAYKALNMTSEEIIEEALNSGLRGRGGAGFPVGLKWKFAAKVNEDTKYVLCNADEGDPGAYMDRSVLEGDPHSIIEGMIIAAKAIGAHKGYIYCRAEYPLAVETLNKAIKDARLYGLLGENILETGYNFDLEVYEGAGAFVCGEETGLMRSIEGKRGMSRNKPPFPANKGLWGKPTVINNVETLANIPQIILYGADWFKSFGTEKSPGTIVFA